MVEYLTENDAAAALGVTPRRVRQLAEAGVLTRHRIGTHRTGYDRDQVDAVATARRLLRGT